MYEDLPSWYTTIYPIYYISGKLLSILTVVLLICFLVIKVFKIKKEKYQGPINIANLIFCMLSTVLLVSYLFELIMLWFVNYSSEQFSYFNRAVGPYWILYVGLMYVPLLLTQFFWRKKNRLNINLALFIVFMFGIHMWFERILIIVTSFMRD